MPAYKGAIISGNRSENVSLILERYPQYANAVNPDSGCCPLHMACGPRLTSRAARGK